ELAPVSAGTSGETPPLPSRPWHCAQAKLTKSCAPAATFGSTACVGGDVETAVVAAVELFVARPRKTPPSSAAAAHASTTSTISAAALSGFWNRLDMPIEGGTGRADRRPYFSVTLGALAGRSARREHSCEISALAAPGGPARRAARDSAYCEHR